MTAVFLNKPAGLNIIMAKVKPMSWFSNRTKGLSWGRYTYCEAVGEHVDRIFPSGPVPQASESALRLL